MQVSDMLFQRRAYDKLVEWKRRSAGEKALPIEGARRVGKSTVAEELGRNEYGSYLLVDFAKASEAIRNAFTRYNAQKHRNDIEVDFIMSNKSKINPKLCRWA